MNEYDKKANKFLTDTKTEFKTEFLRHGKHFEDDKDERDIYEITLKRGSREFKFNFGQSINCSVKYKIVKGCLNENKERLINKGLSLIGCNKLEDKKKYLYYFIGAGNIWETNKEFETPSPYDVLACLQNYEIESLKDFCDSFGYDEDSIKANKIYKKVVEEYNNIQMLYTDEEIEQLREIQ